MLTDAKVRTAKPRPKSYKLVDANRLFLLLTPSGGKLWRWNYYYDGKQKSMAFGAYPMSASAIVWGPAHLRACVVPSERIVTLVPRK